MKKALHDPDKVFLYETEDGIVKWDFSPDEIFAAVNRGLKGEWGDASFQAVMLQELYQWLSRYLEEGATDEFLNELNNDLRKVVYHKYVVPPDIVSSELDDLQSLYVLNCKEFKYSPKLTAANEFSRLVTTGMLKRLKRCQLPDCQNIFLGPPQAKWCSKTCGSKYRVKKKRSKDKF
jgi:hypothetical protein